MVSGAGQDPRTRRRCSKALGVELHVGDITDRESLRGADAEQRRRLPRRRLVQDRRQGRRGIAERVNVQGTRNVLEIAKELADPAGRLHEHGRRVRRHARPDWSTKATTRRARSSPNTTAASGVAHYEVAAADDRGRVAARSSRCRAPSTGPATPARCTTTLVQLLRGRLFMTPNGVTFCWGYVEDIARGLRQAMEPASIGESYLLTGPVETYQDFFAIAARHRRQAPAAPASAAGDDARPWRRLPACSSDGTCACRYPAETLRLMAGTTWIGSSARRRSRQLGFTRGRSRKGLRHTIEHEMRQLGMA